MTLLTAFKILLYKYTAQEDIIIGTAVLNRDRPELEPLIGFFVNMLPIRTDLSGNPRFRYLLRRVKESVVGAFAHQEMPFEKLVEEIQPERELGQMPLFNITFGVQNAPVEEVRLSGLEISPVATEQESARFDLTLWITEGAEALEAGWTYSTDIFDEETIIRLHGHLESLLFNIAARPDATLDDIELLSDAERVEQSANRAIRKEYSYSRFKNIKPKTVTLSEE
jgi:non-ribosomal peptide synthetase component F